MILSLFAALALQTAADPLAPARAGGLQCQQPDPARRTCMALAAYAFAADGTVVNHAEVYVGEGLTMAAATPVVVRGDAVCTGLPDPAGAVFSKGGRPLADAEQAALRSQMAEGYAGLAGIEFCTRYRPDGDGFVTEVSAGESVLPLTTRVIWVDPADGWTVSR